MADDYPIMEYDPSRRAVIEPRELIARKDVPEHAVACFFGEVIERLRRQEQISLVHSLHSEMCEHPVYEMAIDGRRLAVFHPGLGAPLAAGLLEEVIALGCRKFVVCGGAGVLDSEIACGHVVVPASAVRDEGTSYHYLPPGREVAASPRVVTAIEATLKRHDVAYRVGKTWTTDAFYRETRDRVKRRRGEGCLTVEMEAAALFAVAQFRQVELGQLLYGGDDVSGVDWDRRNWRGEPTTREALFGLAAEACLAL